MLGNGEAAMFATNPVPLPRPQGVGKSQRYSMYWTLEKEILLIKYFEQHRYMWDTNHILFHKREPRMQGFAELVELLGIDEGTIRQRWSSMRSQFCREERKVSLCPTYIPTWDHYAALQFLRKPGEEAADDAQTTIEADMREEDEDSWSNRDSVQEEAMNSGAEVLDWMQLATQMASKRQQEPDDDDDSNEVADVSEAQNCSDLVKVEPSCDPPQSPYPIQLPPPTPSQFVRKSRTPRHRRWTPGYNKKYQEISSIASASITNNTTCSSPPHIPTPATTPTPEPIKATENELLMQYMLSVLNRFHPGKQRRCRNELLCVILKYDSLEDDDRPSRSPDLTDKLS